MAVHPATAVVENARQEARQAELAAHPQVVGNILDCGGQQSATPLSADLPTSQSALGSAEYSTS
jgi:hypothetical protein